MFNTMFKQNVPNVNRRLDLKTKTMKNKYYGC